MFLRKRTLESGVCFFDIDGVLNTSANWSTQYTFRKDLVANLCTLVKERNLDLVMTSSWRAGFIAPLDEENLPHIKHLEESMMEFGVVIKANIPLWMVLLCYLRTPQKDLMRWR